MISSRKVYSILTLALALLCCHCESTDKTNDPLHLQGSVVDRPQWVDQGQHAQYPENQYFTAFELTKANLLPSRSEMLRSLCNKMHESVLEPFRHQLDEDIKNASFLGKWVQIQHLPEDGIEVLTWSESSLAASFVAISKSKVYTHNRERAKELKILGQEIQPTPDDQTALEVIRQKVGDFEKVTDDLVTIMLAATLNGELALDAGLLKDANSHALRTKNLRARFRPSLEGGNIKVDLGSRPKSPIRMRLLFSGKAASNIPLEAAFGGISAQADTQTDDLGFAHIRFPDPIEFTGQGDNLIGFRLAPDLLVPGFQSGIQYRPWRTTLTIPSGDNTLVYLKLSAAYKGDPIKNRVVERLKTMIQAAGMPMTTDPKVAEESKHAFVLEIQGALGCHPVKTKDNLPARQLKCDGALLLRHFKSTTAPVVSVTFVGYGDIIEDQKMEAAEAAVEDAWKRSAALFVSQSRDVFPPLFLKDAIEDLKRRESLARAKDEAGK